MAAAEEEEEEEVERFCKCAGTCPECRAAKEEDEYFENRPDCGCTGKEGPCPKLTKMKELRER
jgi:hypothetical protein